MMPDATEQVSVLMCAALDRLEPSELYKLKSELDRKDEKVAFQLAPKKSAVQKQNSKNNDFKI